MNLLERLVDIPSLAEKRSIEAREAMMDMLETCQATLDNIALINKYVNSRDVEFDKDIHYMGSLCGDNSIDGFYLQIIIDKQTKELIDARFVANSNFRDDQC